jgi:hypothetical protein
MPGPGMAFRNAHASILARIRAVQDGEFVPITVDIPAAVTTVLGVQPELKALRPQLVKDMPNFPISEFDNLETYALALGHTQTLYKTATDPPAAFVAMVDSAIKTREILLADVNALISRGLIDAKATSELKGINGYKNIAFDIFALANVLKSHWDKVSGRTGVKSEELDQAEVQADHLVTATGEREQAPEVAAEVVRDRQAAFTLFINAYEEVRAAVAYIRRKQGDAESIAPSLYAGRTASKKKPADEPDATTPAATPVVTPAQPAVPGTVAAATPALKADIAANGPFMT